MRGHHSSSRHFGRRSLVSRFCPRVAPLHLIAAAISSIVAFVPAAQAQLPAARLESLFPPGGAPGSAVELTISGTDLDDVNRLIFSGDGFQIEQKMTEATPFDESHPVANVFHVTIADSVPPGHYEVRCHGRYGLSNAKTFVVGSLPEVTETEPNNERAEATEVTLPVTINGQSSGGPDVDWYRFAGKAGQRIILRGIAWQIDSRMEMAIAVENAAGTLIAENRVAEPGDPVVDLTLPADGEYFLKVHDALYAQGNGYHYRLQAGEMPYIDFVMPPVALPGSNEEFTIYGRNLPGGSQSELQVGNVRLEQTTVRIAMPQQPAERDVSGSRIEPHEAAIDGIGYRIENGGQTSNAVTISAATAPVVREAPQNDSPDAAQTLTLPCEVAGQFYPQRDVDWFRFEAKKDETWIVDVVSQRLGLPTNPAILIQRIETTDDGQQKISDIQFLDDLASPNFNNRAGQYEFDERSGDPTHSFTAPADGTYRLLLMDAYSTLKSDPRLVYRLAIRRAQPDFRIVAVAGDSNGALMLRKGGRDVIRVVVYRQDGYDGAIKVHASGLPERVTCEDMIIGPANSFGTLVLTAAPDAAGPAISTVTVEATATIAEAEVKRMARYGAAQRPFQFASSRTNIGGVPARLVNGIQLCVSEQEVSPGLLTIGDARALETARGGILTIPMTFTRAEGAGGTLTAFPIDFPPNTNAQQVNVGGADKGELTLRFQANTPPGTYSISVAGFFQNLQYSRNPDSLEKAKERQTRIAEILKKAQEDAAQRTKDAQQRQTELAQAGTVLQQATAAKQQADRDMATADAALKQATDAMKLTEEQAKASPEDEAAKLRLADAQKKLTEVTAQTEKAKTTATEAATKLEEATALRNAADEAKKKADADVQAANQFQQQAQQEKQRADQFVTQKTNETRARNFNARMPSNSVTITVTEFPIEIKSLPEALSVQQGETIELPVSIARLYDFTSNVSVQVQLPGGVGGISPQNINIAQDKTDEKSTIATQPTATVGDHECTIRLQMNFNGQNLVMDRPFKLTVTEKPKESE